MNGLSIAVLLIIVVFAFIGYCRGFIKVFFSLLSFVITIILVNAVSPYISDFLYEKTPLYQSVYEGCMDFLDEERNGQTATKSDQIAEIESYQIPDMLKESLIENNNSEIYEMLDVSAFEEYIIAYIAKMIINAIAFVAAFLIITIFMRAAIFSLDIISKLPVINGFNKVLGLTAGVLEGVFIVWIIFLLLTIISGSELAKSLLPMIVENPFLSFLYNNNILMKFIL